jgi:16S rRNA (cytosine1402-N4)-methyltransferase
MLPEQRDVSTGFTALVTLPEDMHIPVLLHETIEALDLTPGANCIDATVGAGGHSQAILEATAADGRLIGFDRDADALALASQRLKQYSDRFVPIHDSFASLAQHRYEIDAVGPIHGIVADLGLSSMQLDQAERGFAFRLDAPLDMRFDQSSGETAAELLANTDQHALADMLYQFADERQSRRIARAIVEARQIEPIRTTMELAGLIEKTIGRRPGSKKHPATRTFQALRIAVNQELEHVQRFIPQAIDTLHPGGRLAIITFHSIEDRLVKQAFKLAARDCICPLEVPECRCDHTATVDIINRKSIKPDTKEQKQNSRSRSAQLRIVQKKHL